MKVRIKFQKYGAMKFIGHLDVMRYFQKAFRRAGVDNEYSKGYSPHQIMSFAAPLGVGLTSDSEYVDVQLLSSDAPDIMIERINAVMTEGFRITGFHILQDREENQKKVTAMSLLSSADYLVSRKDGYPIVEKIRTQELFQQEFTTFMNQKEIIVDKKTKTTEKSVDIRPMITLTAYNSEEYEANRKETLVMEADSSWNSVADVYDNGIKVFLQVHTGSSVNLKPELVLEEFCKFIGMEYLHYEWQVHRIELYSREEMSGKLIPLDRLEQ